MTPLSKQTVKQIDLTQQLEQMFLEDFAEEKIYYNLTLKEAIANNIKTRAELGTRQDLRNYLQELPAKYKDREWVTQAVLDLLDTYAPEEREWFQKVLLL